MVERLDVRRHVLIDQYLLGVHFVDPKLAFSQVGQR